MSVGKFAMSEPAKEDHKLDAPQNKYSPVFCAPSPGEIISKLQEQLLKRDRFISVFGGPTVESWKLNWDKIESLDISFDDSCRLSAMHLIDQVLVRYINRSDEEFRALFHEYCNLDFRISGINSVRLESEAEKYFTAIFPGSTVENDFKDKGVQLGSKATVTLATGENRLYHVKTHSQGLLSSNSTIAEVVDPRELLTYKILEYVGLGCETHFFQRSAKDVYIATLDAGHDGSFDVFAKAAGNLHMRGDEVYGQSLWGALQDIHTDPAQRNLETVAAAIECDATAQNFISQVIMLDLLKRILRLCDVLDNTENFGFLIREGDRPVVKVLDFRVEHERFCWDLSGYGCYNDLQYHRAVQYALYDITRAERVATALQLLTHGTLSHLHENVVLAYEDISAYINNTDVFTVHRAFLMEKLNIYQNQIHKNIDYLIGILAHGKRL